MKFDINLWAALGGMTTMLATLGALGLWALKQIIRSEMAPIRGDLERLGDQLGRVDRDVVRLNATVFPSEWAERERTRAANGVV